MVLLMFFRIMLSLRMPLDSLHEHKPLAQIIICCV